MDDSTRGADKSLARPGRKKATANKLWLLQATQKKKKIQNLSVQPGLRGSEDLRVGRKMTFQWFIQSGQAKDLSAPQYIATSGTAEKYSVRWV